MGNKEERINWEVRVRDCLNCFLGWKWVCFFISFHFGCSFLRGLCAQPSLMGEAACSVRKYCGFGEGGGCKFFWGMGLKNFGEFGYSKIVQTWSMRIRGPGAGIYCNHWFTLIFGWLVKRIQGVVFSPQCARALVCCRRAWRFGAPCYVWNWWV